MTKQSQATEPTLFDRFISAKNALTETIQKILDLNKSLRRTQKSPENLAIKQELKLLNKVADHQAKIVQMYELKMQTASNL